MFVFFSKRSNQRSDDWPSLSLRKS